MATVNFSVPDEVKEAFNKEFDGQNKSAVIADLMRKAVEDAQAQKRRAQAIDEILEFRQRTDLPAMTHEEIRQDSRRGAFLRLVTLDASVICKWFLTDWQEDAHVREALIITAQLRSGQLLVMQPPHWLAEVAAVLVRRLPNAAEWLVQRLLAMDVEVVQSAPVYRHAVVLARSTTAHLFDTLYHAVAMQVRATLITADERYYRAVHENGSIVLLKDWRQGS